MGHGAWVMGNGRSEAEGRNHRWQLTPSKLTNPAITDYRLPILLLPITDYLLTSVPHVTEKGYSSAVT